MNEFYHLNLAALGYIDPNTGTLVLQMILASFVGVTVFFRRAIAKIFRRGGKPDSTPPSEPTSLPPSEDSARKQ